MVCVIGLVGVKPLNVKEILDFYVLLIVTCIQSNPDGHESINRGI